MQRGDAAAERLPSSGAGAKDGELCNASSSAQVGVSLARLAYRSGAELTDDSLLLFGLCQKILLEFRAESVVLDCLSRLILR